MLQEEGATWLLGARTASHGEDEQQDHDDRAKTNLEPDLAAITLLGLVVVDGHARAYRRVPVLAYKIPRRDTGRLVGGDVNGPHGEAVSLSPSS